jgi:hypothetical protein
MQQLHLDRAALDARVDEVRESPSDVGTIDLIVTRPDLKQREILDEAQLDLELGLVGDNWKARGNSKTVDGAADPLGQITIMNVRAVALIAGDRDRWPLAGDQFYVDFDLSEANVPPGRRLALGTAIVEVSDKDHLGCQKFSDRFGTDAWRFVNSPVGRELNVRGINGFVVQPGTVRVGDAIRKL